MNTQEFNPTYEADNDDIALSELCETYPECCEFCDYNISGFCSLFRQKIAQEEK